MVELVYKEECFKIVGACIEVHNTLGCGFLEPIYQEALSIEFQKQKIPFEREKTLTVVYKDIELEKKYVADFVCYEKIIVELKALSSLDSEHESQILNYLKATGCKIGLLINFGEKSLKYKRMIL